MKTVYLPSISNNDEVTNCVMMDLKEINTKLICLNGFAYNYILCLGDEIVYIGYSSSLYTRLFCHKHSKNFDKIVLIEFKNKKSALYKERELIKQYRPKYNVQFLQ